MQKIYLISGLIELTYLSLSFYLAELFGQWSYQGEIFRAFLRIFSIAIIYYFYRKYYYAKSIDIKLNKINKPFFLVSVFLLLLLAIFFTNAEGESTAWQSVFFVSGILAGLREELVYRGILQNTLQTKLNHRTALFISCVVFTLSHVQNIFYLQGFALLLISLAGIIFGSIYIYTGSVLIAGAIHGFYDAFLSVKLISVKLTDIQGLIALSSISLLFLLLIRVQLSNKQLSGNTDLN